MIEIIKEPIWQFLGVVLALLAIITTIVIYYLQKKRKKLSYDIVYTHQLVSKQKRISNKLEILFEGKPVKNINLLIIRILNAGNVPIITSDFEREIVLTFGETANILSAQVIYTEPVDLIVSLRTLENNLIIEPLLLNPKDLISIEIILSGESYTIDAKTRIIGVKSIDRGLDIIPMPPVSAGYTLISIGLIIFFVGIISTGFNSGIENYVGGGLIAIVSGFYLLIMRSWLRSEKYGLMFIELSSILRKYLRKRISSEKGTL